MKTVFSFLCIAFLIPVVFLHFLLERLGIIKKADKKNWKIYISPAGNYRCVQITDPDADFVPMLFVAILDFFLKEQALIAVSQYIDKNQGMLPDKEISLEAVSGQYQLKTAKNYKTSSITHCAPHPDIEDEFILNILGKPRLEWLDSLMVFGGASLSNMIYAVQAEDQNWLENISAWNDQFSKWYWLESRETDLMQVKQSIPVLCWTSDSELFILQEETKLWRLISKLNELADEYGLILDIEKREPY